MTRSAAATEPSFAPIQPDVSAPPPRKATDAAKAEDARPAPPFSPSSFPASPPAVSVPPLSQQIGDWDEKTSAPRARNLYASFEAAPPGTPAPLAPHASTDFVTLAASPLMRASASLLLLFGRLRASLARAGPNQLMDQVAQALQQFEVDARAANAPTDQIETYQVRACRLRRRHRAKSAE